MTNNKSTLAGKMTQYRWVICAMLFFATTVNYLDRQVLSLTWDEFIKPEFHWNEYHYGLITSIFSIVYAVCMLFAGRFIDWMGTKKGYLWAIGVWSMGACMHALCGIATEAWVGLPDAAALRAVEAGSANIFSTIGDMFPKSAIATVTGIGGMAGGVGSMILQWFAGWLFVYADETAMQFMGFEGKPAGYFVVFCICAVAYLIGWIVMKTLVPKYKPIVLD